MPTSTRLPLRDSRIRDGGTVSSACKLSQSLRYPCLISHLNTSVKRRARSEREICSRSNMWRKEDRWRSDSDGWRRVKYMSGRLASVDRPAAVGLLCGLFSYSTTPTDMQVWQPSPLGSTVTAPISRLIFIVPTSCSLHMLL